jgi:hypothetical protein
MPDHEHPIPRRRKEFRFELSRELEQYTLRMKARLGMSSADFFTMCLNHFRHSYPSHGDLFLLVDEEMNTYTIVEVEDSGFPRMIESDNFTCSVKSLVNNLRDRYPSLIFGREHVFWRPAP